MRRKGFFSSALHRSFLFENVKLFDLWESLKFVFDWYDDSLVCVLGFELATENRHRRIS